MNESFPEHDLSLPSSSSPSHLRPRRRRSSLLNRWIQEQRLSTISSSRNSHGSASDLADALDNSLSIGATPANPYLAYPDIKRTFKPDSDDVDTLDSYDVVRDDEFIPDGATGFPQYHHHQPHVNGITPTRSRFQASLRHLAISIPFRSNSHSPSPLSTSMTSSTAKSRLSIFPSSAQRSTATPTTGAFPYPSVPSTPPTRRSTKPTHSKSSSLPMFTPPSSSTPSSSSTPNSSANANAPQIYCNPATPSSSPRFLSPALSKWRPSVLGHFSSASTSSVSSREEPDIVPSRPSFSSTYSSTTATTEPVTPLRAKHNSSQSTFNKGPSSLTIWSNPTFASASAGSSSSRQSMDGVYHYNRPGSPSSPCQPQIYYCNCCGSSYQPFDYTSASASANGSNDMTRPRAISTTTTLLSGFSTSTGAYQRQQRMYPSAVAAAPGSSGTCDRCAMAGVGSYQQQQQQQKATAKGRTKPVPAIDPTKPYEVYTSIGKASSALAGKPSSIIGSTKAPSIVGSTRAGSSHHSAKYKRKLVISGIAPGEERRLDGIKKWCEGFGEVKRIVRMPNGELVVEWCDRDVADTVCRLRAGVNIAGVGSVHLSWCQGKKR